MKEGKVHISCKQSNSSDFTAGFPESATTWVLQEAGRHPMFTLFRNSPTFKAVSCAITHWIIWKTKLHAKLLYYSTADMEQKVMILQIIKSRLNAVVIMTNQPAKSNLAVAWEVKDYRKPLQRWKSTDTKIRRRLSQWFPEFSVKRLQFQMLKNALLHPK